jgi:autotransporter-associated beta strand protein
MTCRQLWGSWMLIGISWIAIVPANADGQFLVSDRLGNQILEYNPDGSYRRAFETPIDSTLGTPSGMTLGNGTDMFVTSLTSGEVIRYNWVTGHCYGDFASGLYGPSGLLFDRPNNRLYVSEFGNYDGKQIVCYNATSGAEIARFGDEAAGAGRAGMAMGSDGKVYVSDWYDGQIMRFDPANNYSAEVFAGAANLWGSNGLVFDSSGNLDVVGMMSNNVYQFNSSGAAAGELVTAATGGLNFPSGIVIDTNGNLLISSMGDYVANGYIGKYNSSTGATIDANYITFSGSTLVQPTAMLIGPAVWKNGNAEIEQNTQLGPGGDPFDTGNQKLVVSGVIGETGGAQSLTKTGSGELVLKAINTYTGATNVNQGTLTIDGGDLADVSAVNVAAGATLQVVSGAPGLGNVAGLGSTSVSGAGTVLSVNSISQNTLTIGSGATVIINPIPGGPLGTDSIQAVPEPGTMALLTSAGLLAPIFYLSRRWKRV